jgi:hypothetical protein
MPFFIEVKAITLMDPFYRLISTWTIEYVVCVHDCDPALLGGLNQVLSPGFIAWSL